MADADHFEFTGHGVHVDYLPLGAGAVPHLSYQDADRKLTFVGGDIRIGTGDPRGGVTVDLERGPNRDTVTFTLFVPEVQVADGERATVSTIAVTTDTVAGTTRTARLPLVVDQYSAIRLHGFAEKRTGVQPLDG